ncbi:RSVR protein, partial [Penelope pileata]|nr:RSVR protein [Penelope pileata]
PEEFQCVELPEPLCLPREWLCDGHPDCDDAWDERGCGLNSTGTGGRGGVLPAPAACWDPWRAMEPGVGPGAVRGSLLVHSFSLVLLSCLVAVGGIAAWGKSKAKSRSDVFGLEKASREQLMPHK